MAAYTLIVDTFNGSYINSITFNAIGGDGLSSGNPFVMQVGDTLAIQNDYTQQINPDTAFNGALDIVGWTTGYWNSTSSLLSFADTTSTARTILAAAAGNTLTLAASANQGGNALAGSDQFYIEVAAESIDPPSGLSETLNNTESGTEDVTLNLTTSGSGGTLEYLQTTDTTITSTGWQTSNSFEQPRNTTRYYWASRDRDGTSSIGPLTVTVDYLNVKSYSVVIDGSSGVVDFPYTKTDFDITYSGTDTDHTYEVLYDSNSDFSTAASAGTITSTSNPQTITISGTEMVPAGGTMYYRVRAKRGTTTGGDGVTYSNLVPSFTRNRYPQTPTGVTLTDPGTEAPSAVFTITVTGTGGANTSIASLSSDYSNPATSGSGTLTLSRSGTTVYLKNTGVNSLTGTATVTSPETYLAVDNTIGVSPSSQTLSQGDTSFNITVSGIDANKGMYYQVRDFNGTIHEEGTPATNATSVSITVTDTPATSPETYTIFSKRLEDTGGSNSYATSGITFTATPFGGATDSAPVISNISQANGANANVKNITVNLSSTGSGGTALEYAKSTSNSIPSTGWQTSSTFNSLSVGTTYYFWASRNQNTSLFSSSVSYTPNNAEYGIIIQNTSGQSIVDTRSDKQSTAIKVGNLTLAGVTLTIVNGSKYIIRATGTNSTSFGAANNDVGTIFTATSSGTLTGGNVGKFQEVTGVTGMTSTNSDEIGIIVQTENSYGILSLYSIHRDSGKFSFAPKYPNSLNIAYIVVRY